MRGKLIVLEGIDNAGKTTQIGRVGNWLESKGWPYTVTRELSTPVGNLIRLYFDSDYFSPILKTLLFAADRTVRIDREVLPALQSGCVVLADRWVQSAVVYRLVEGLEQKFVENVNAYAPTPDVVILLDISSEEAFRRGKLAGKISPYSASFLSRARDVYLELADAYSMPVINGMLPEEQVTQLIIKELDRLFYPRRK